MKNTISIVLLILSLFMVIATVGCTIYGIYDIEQIKNELANNPSASGIDYMGIGWGYGIILLALSIFGVIISVINIKLTDKKILRYISTFEVILFVVLMIIAVFLFYV